MTREANIQMIVRKAELLFASRYRGAEFCVASGSIIQGHGLKHSDLDLVVVYRSLSTAYRESFGFDGTPVEAFVHDYETIQFFMDDDFQKGNASMQHMLATGKVIPSETAASVKLVEYARKAMNEGLKHFSPEKIDALRYAISDLIDDLKDERPAEEMRSILYTLYQTMGELRLRLAGRFLGTGKHLARKLQDCDPVFSGKLQAILAKAHTEGLASQDIDILSSLADQLGGHLFDGYRQNATSEMKSSAKWFLN